MKFTLEIDCDKAAFGETPIEIRDETSRILVDIAKRLTNHAVPIAVGGSTILRDINGKRVGEVKFTEENTPQQIEAKFAQALLDSMELDGVDFVAKFNAMSAREKLEQAIKKASQ